MSIATGSLFLRVPLSARGAQITIQHARQPKQTEIATAGVDEEARGMGGGSAR